MIIICYNTCMYVHVYAFLQELSHHLCLWYSCSLHQDLRLPCRGRYYRINSMSILYCYYSFCKVIDQGIMPVGFNATCWLNDTLIRCQLTDVSTNQLTISLPLDAVVEGQIIRFTTGYSYRLCVNSLIETELTGV